MMVVSRLNRDFKLGVHINLDDFNLDMTFTCDLGVALTFSIQSHIV